MKLAGGGSAFIAAPIAEPDCFTLGRYPFCTDGSRPIDRTPALRAAGRAWDAPVGRT